VSSSLMNDKGCHLPKERMFKKENKRAEGSPFEPKARRDIYERGMLRVSSSLMNDKGHHLPKERMFKKENKRAEGSPFEPKARRDIYER
jgi:hypothetical protein